MPEGDSGSERRPDVDGLEIHLDQLTEKFKDLKTSDEIFLNLLQKKAGITQTEYEKEYEIAQDYYEKLSTFKIKGDEIVLLEDNNKRRSYWNLARVLKVIPGRDGQIRLALIKTENSELLRPVQRLYRLELENPVEKTGDEPIPLTTRSGTVVKTPAK
ncbi:integrase catalytic domain-containing protein [Nephila pilipes]|uniref:Integrase catalytic domain-containing protein n=1 Tax=Nephila pilipes TaxID=299642 RepID=A0A8X6MEF8_NEPPI|nr:integrase catalytic domain-containing protein [Nephila pilipes]